MAVPILTRAFKFVRRVFQNLTSVTSATWLTWWGPIGAITESFSGAWQQNVTLIATPNLLAFSAVFACVTGIAADVAKMRIKLSRNEDGIWVEITKNQPWLPLLRKPNHYQTRIKFVEQWIVSKLLWGNAYILKQRDERGIVNALYVLNPMLVTPLVANDGSVFYQLRKDLLSQVTTDNFDTNDPIVPASEIIHDTMVALWHPLIGVSPIWACGISATMGNKIQSNSTQFFANMSRPGGILTAPGHISDDTAARLKTAFEANYGGTNVGRMAVLGDGLKFETTIIPAETSQLIEQLKWTVEDVGRAFHYPIWKLGGPMPAYSSGPQAATMVYYTDCLQPIIESFEEHLDNGLELPLGMGTELDLDELMRMDTVALFESNAKAVGGGWMAPNEARFRANLRDVEGGGSPMIQEQNFSLSALAKRDAQEDPFAPKAAATPTETLATTNEPTPPVIAEREINVDGPDIESAFKKELVLTCA